MDKFRFRLEVFHLPFTCSKSTKKHLNNVPNIFKVNTKDTRTSGASIANFEHISKFILLLILLNSNKKMPVGLLFILNSFSVTVKKNIVPWARKIYLAICFHFYSSNIRLGKDKFSQQLFKKICRTMNSTNAQMNSRSAPAL